MKKVILTISRGSIARNFLQNNFYTLLRENYKVVMLTPAYDDPRFITEFKHPNVTFQNLGLSTHNFLDRLLFFFHKYLAYNSTINQKSHWGIIGDPRSKKYNYLIYIIKKIIFVPLSHIKILRELVRKIDYHIGQRSEVSEFRSMIQKEKPDGIVITNISDDMEAAFLKAAKKEKTKTIAIPKSWDNLSKAGFRSKANRLVVWNAFMKNQAKRYQNYTDRNVTVIGVPQFDYYIDESRIWDREQFCKLYNFDPKKKIIMFSSEGKLFPSDSDVASVIYDSIQNKKLKKECQLLVRPHYGFKNEVEKFKHLLGKTNVAVDLFNDPSPQFRDKWDYSIEAMDRFLNMIYHSDININTHSSLTLDVIGFDKPIINIMFDGYKKKPYKDSIIRWYETDYYREILSYHATKETHNPEELIEALNQYLEDPSIKREERKRLRESFCYKLDGGSGTRFFEAVKKEIG